MKAKSKIQNGSGILRHIDELLTMSGVAKKQARRVKEADLGILKKQAILFLDGKIAWIGSDQKIPKNLTKKKLKEYNLKGQTVLPGLVECHTHTLFAGDRSAEFELRNQGVSYQEINAKGGGILSTVNPTRQISAKNLHALGQARVANFQAQGVTTLEIKSGYALDLKNEIKLLKVAKSLTGVRVVPTFLGPHARPPEFSTYEKYLDFVIQKVLPEIKKLKLSHRADIFIEKGFFESEVAEAYLKKTQELGFDLVIHADQLSLSGGTELALKYKAISADHLLQIDSSLIQKLAKSETTAVLLPAADLYMKCKYPPGRDLIDAGARVALATDFNPGSSPTQDLQLVGLLARLEMKLSLPEVLSAYTMGAAYALGLQGEVGSLELNKSADFFSTKNSWQRLFYQVGERPASMTFTRGISNFLSFS